MKRILLATLILFSIIKTEAQCGSFPLSVFVPTLTCAQPTGAFAITTTVSPVTCVWEGPGIVSGGNTLNPNINVGGVYAFTITNTNNGCNAIYNINVQSPVSVTNPNISCSTPTAIMTANPSFTATSFSWSGPGIISGNTTNTITVNASGYYVCTVSNTLTGCQVSGSGSVTSNTFVPPITINNNTLNCYSPTVDLIATSTTFSPSLLNFSWQGSGIVSGSTTQTATINAAGVYTCFVTNTLNGCTSSTTGMVFSNIGSPSIMTSGGGNICAGQTATLNTVVSPSFGIYLTWSPSSGLNSTHNPSVIASPTSSTVYSVTATNTVTGCTSIATIIVGVSSNPTISIMSSNNNSVCTSSSIDLVASGANTYTWSSSTTLSSANSSSVTASPLASTIYTVTGAVGACVNTQTVNVTVDNTCANVWPGDANSDGVADNLDVLELGLHFAQTGLPRATMSNTWQSYFANNWTGTITNGSNLNHSDCNGDGSINDDDTLAIYNNYGLSHFFKTAQTTTINPQLTIVPDQDMVAKGTWGSASIYLGDAATSINNINGVAFTVNFDNTLIESNNIYIEYQNSFFDLAHQNLYFRKLDLANGKIYTASTHTINNNISGFGKIATLHYQILSSLTSDQVLNLSVAQANQSDALGTITPLTSGTGTLMAIGASVGLAESLNNNLISISPNPTNGLLSVTSKTELQKIEVMSIAGQLLLSEASTNNHHTLHLENYSNGIYFINIYQNNSIVKREKVIINK